MRKIQTINIDEIKENPENPRTIKPKRFEALKESIKKYPRLLELRPLILDDKNVVIAGTMRLRAMRELGYKKTTYIRADDLTAKERRRFIVLDNVPFGEWDEEALALNFGPEDLDGLGIDLKDITAPGEAVEDDYAGVPKSTKIKPGDLVEIGPHRILCGDSTKPEDVERAMNGEKADVVFTDPPYGVSIVGTRQNKTIAGDLTQAAIPLAVDLSVNIATNDTAAFYFCGGEGNIGLYQKLFERFLRMMPRHLIWVKESHVMKPNGYHCQYEIIFHGYKKGGGGLDHWMGGRTMAEASDVWQIRRDKVANYLHPTQKPVAIAYRAISNHSPAGGLVYEPFAGSGSTYVAAHQLGRRCFGLEIEPLYCQVTIDRLIASDESLRHKIKINGKAAQL